ncbi:dihydrofolate reductase family protein [Spirosoma sp. BT702]|uniref:Dihydrofolate reductase family protein n=1 Tax=Spirosoma profusum TaxID=2771354 RepID=A0A927ATW1_9BACT|nr:dihydrofolate reductase family protein [Spirosoma profusum]MBD2701247.1 dihydrofolate reductase family protein [Spirosoma profusum]
MRKLKLQVQITLDGFIGGPNGEMDWLTMNWGEDVMRYVGSITEPVDTILLGRKLAEGFIPAWQSRLDTPETAPGAEKMVNTPKIVFSKTLESIEGKNATVNNGNLVEEVNALKSQDGADIIAYGGAEFVSSLIKNNLIDEYHLFVNPVAQGKGLSIFGDIGSKLNLKLVEAKAFDCGITLLHYQPAS